MLSRHSYSQPHDFTLTLSSLLGPSFFPSTNGATDEEKLALKEMVQRWQKYVDEGKFRLSTPLDLKMGEKGGELADCKFVSRFTEAGIKAGSLDGRRWAFSHKLDER